jgi:hypothetical protein
MSLSLSNVVGEGTYGCVHKPSLRCDKVNVDYKEKVSKLMSSSNANTELREYLAISKADPEGEFYLGMPIKCKPEKTKTNYESARKCRHLRNMAIDVKKEEIKDGYNLLVMEDGGLNLRDFGKEMRSRPINRRSGKIMENFWIECHRLFLGLLLLKEKDLIHNDLKGQNIVYNESKNRVSLIDFGLMRPLSRTYNAVMISDVEVEHWSYPVETIFYMKERYNSNAYRNEIEKRLKRGIENVYNPSFLSEVVPTNGPVSNSDVVTLLYTSMLRTIHNTKTIPRKEFIRKSIETFDLYGTCMGLLYVLRVTMDHLIKTRSKIDVVKLYNFLLNCVRPDENRYTVEEALSFYETEILYDILKEDGIIIENHVLKKVDMRGVDKKVKIETKEVEIEKRMEEEDKKREVDEIEFVKNILKGLNVDYVKEKKCEEGKELNPNTGRCVNKCKEGEVRDEKYKCIKTKKNNKMNSKKKCEEGKELNPNTGRCVKKCKEGEVRDEKYKCIKTKKNNKMNSKKKCEEGKEVNPNTGRCVKKCKEGEVRDEKYRCKTMKKRV